jgi:hypothetical protein
MNAKIISLSFCRGCVARLLRRNPKTTPAQRKPKHHRRHGVTTLFEMP